MIAAPLWTLSSIEGPALPAPGKNAVLAGFGAVQPDKNGVLAVQPGQEDLVRPTKVGTVPAGTSATATQSTKRTSRGLPEQIGHPLVAPHVLGLVAVGAGDQLHPGRPEGGDGGRPRAAPLLVHLDGRAAV